MTRMPRGRGHEPTPRGGGDASVRAVVVTGGIGSGKSTFCRLMRADGDVAHIDADRIVRGLLRHNADLHERIVAAFGRGVLSRDGRIDRAELGARVFGSRRDLRRLEGWLHPLVRERMARKVASLKRGGEVAIVLAEVPLLAEGGIPAWCDLVVAIEADRDVRLARVARRGLDPRAAERRMQRQATDQERRRLADLVICNNGTPEALLLGGQRLRRMLRGAPRGP